MSLLKASELAKKLNVTTVTIRNYAKRGMPCVTIGKQKKYLEESVNEWLKNGGEASK